VKANKFLLMLGLCKRAGAMAIGTPMVVKGLQEKKLTCVFYSANASANTEKRIKDKCAYYGVECYQTGYTSEELGAAVGRSGAVSALGITDINFSNELTTLNLNEKR